MVMIHDNAYDTFYTCPNIEEHDHVLCKKVPEVTKQYLDSGPMSHCHDDVIKWKYFPRYWPFVQGIHRSLVNSPHKGQWRGALMFSLICAWINRWVNNREAGDLRRHRFHYDVIVMALLWRFYCLFSIKHHNRPHHVTIKSSLNQMDIATSIRCHFDIKCVFGVRTNSNLITFHCPSRNAVKDNYSPKTCSRPT